MVDYEYKELFRQTSVDKQLDISVDDDRENITNDELAYENFELTESLCSEESLRFGACESSQLKIRVLNNFGSLKGRTITVCEVIGGKSSTPFTFGTYMVDSDKMTSDRKYRDIVAYDALHTIISTDYFDWYGNLKFPITVKAMRDSFAEKTGLEQVEVTLPFDDIEIPADTNVTTECTGATILQAIGELNACFAHINREGKLVWLALPELDPPMADIEKYSANSLAQYESFTTANITKLKITAGNIEEIFGDSVSDKENLYVIDGNILMNGMEEAQIEEIGDQLLTLYAKYSYRPFSGEFSGNPCYEVGDSIRYYDGDVLIDSYILQRTLTGIQHLVDTYSASGKEFLDNSMNTGNKLTQSQINSIVEQAGLVIQPFTNKKKLEVKHSWMNVAQIAFKATKDTVIAFAATIPFELDADGIIDVGYFLEGTQLNSVPVRQYYEKGNNVLTLVRTFEALKGTNATFMVLLKTMYCESKNRVQDAQIKGLIQALQFGGTYTQAEIDTTVPTASIEEMAVKAFLFSSGLDNSKSKNWDGTIEIEEEVPSLIKLTSQKVAVNAVSDAVNVTTQPPVSNGMTETVGLIAISANPIEILGYNISFNIEESE